MNVRKQLFYTCINRGSSVRIWEVFVRKTQKDSKYPALERNKLHWENVWVLKHHFHSNTKLFILFYVLCQFTFISLLIVLIFYICFKNFKPFNIVEIIFHISFLNCFDQVKTLYVSTQNYKQKLLALCPEIL